jgi:glucose 1-dehydrogenase
VALVIGGAQGIGRAIAERLASEGARVTIADIDSRAMGEAAAAMRRRGLNVATAVCDVRRQRQIEAVVAQLVRRERRLDILMYIAGVGRPVPFTATTEKIWDWTLDINLKGAFLSASAVAPQMIRQGGGRMVFMASTNAWDAEAELAPYNASKAGIFLLAKTLARELGRYGIRSNAVGPGLIRTRLTAAMLKDPKFMRKYRGLIPLGRLGEPEDIAGPAVFLASRDADYISGTLLFVDGGQLA